MNSEPPHDHASTYAETCNREDVLLHRHALRQILRLIDIAAPEEGDVVGEELQRDYVDQRGKELDELHHDHDVCHGDVFDGSRK